MERLAAIFRVVLFLGGIALVPVGVLLAAVGVSLGAAGVVAIVGLALAWFAWKDDWKGLLGFLLSP